MLAAKPVVNKSDGTSTETRMLINKNEKLSIGKAVSTVLYKISICQW